MVVSIGEISSAGSFSNFPGMLSGLVALCGLMLFKSFRTPALMSGTGELDFSGKLVVTSCVNTEVNCSFSILA